MAEYDHNQQDLREQIVNLVYYNGLSREEAWALSPVERKEYFDFTRKRLKVNDIDETQFTSE